MVYIPQTRERKKIISARGRCFREMPSLDSMREHRKPVCTAVFDQNQGKEHESQQPAEAITKDAKRGKQECSGKAYEGHN